ncbi:MAG TPA: hypothetical protein DCQ43_07670 [Treponema sp.]|nr:hypothetical protein [Treponema sp.]
MKHNGTFTLLATALALSMFPACTQSSFQMQKFPNGQPNGQPMGMFSSKTSTEETAAISSVDTSLLLSDEDDIANVTFSESASLNLSTGTFTTSNQSITLSSETKSDGSIYYTIDTASVSSGVKLTLTGSLAKGSVEIVPKKGSDIQIALADAHITSGNYAALTVSKVARTFLTLTGSNSLTDGRTYGTGYSKAEGTDYYSASYTGSTEDAELTQKWAEGDDTKATLYTKGSLLISGSGSLTVSENYKHGIYSKDYIRIFSGNVSVENGGRSAIRSANGFILTDGTVTINGTATNAQHPNDNSRGIIVEGSEDDGAGKGYIYISGGTVNIKSTGKAISAKWELEEDAETETTDDDPNPVVMICGGTVNVTTTDVVIDSDMNPQTISYYDADGVLVSETSSCSPEGIEGKTGVIISGGTVSVQSTDDALNASLDENGFVNIFGGNIYLYATSADAIDSNGDINISGGNIVALAPMGSEDGFDCDGGLSFTGGNAVGLSGSTHAYASEQNTSCTQTTFVIESSYAASAGNTIVIKDADGSTVFAFTIPQNINSYGIITVSSSSLQKGKTYTVYKASQISGGKNFYGLYTSMPSVTDASSTGSITTSSEKSVYTLGEFNSFGAGPGAPDRNAFENGSGRPFGGTPPSDRGPRR